MYLRLASIVGALFICCGELLAQSDSIIGEAGRNNFRSVNSAITALASDDDLSAGNYHFKNSTSPDADVDLTKWDSEITIGDLNARFAPIVQLSPAYLELEQEYPDGTGQSDLAVDSWSFGAGVGIRMKFFDNALEITPRIKIEYSEVDFDFDISGFDHTLLNQIIPDVDAWSYIPSLEGVYRQKVREGDDAIILRSRLSYIYVDASTSNSNIDNFSDESWILKNSVQYEHGVSLGGAINELKLRPSISRVDMHGAARDGFEFNNFYEFGLNLISSEFLTQYFREIGIGSTYVYEQQVQGWRFGLFGKLY